MKDPDLLAAAEMIEAAVAALTLDEIGQAYGAKWPIAGILEHLGKGYAGTAYILDKCAADGRARGVRPTPWQWFVSTLLLRLGYLPTGTRAPRVTVPEGIAPEAALRAAREGLRLLDDAVARCSPIFDARTRLANHPILGGLTLPEWVRFHRLHTRHHARQIEARRTGMARRQS